MLFIHEKIVCLKSAVCLRHFVVLPVAHHPFADAPSEVWMGRFTNVGLELLPVFLIRLVERNRVIFYTMHARTLRWATSRSNPHLWLGKRRRIVWNVFFVRLLGFRLVRLFINSCSLCLWWLERYGRSPRRLSRCHTGGLLLGFFVFNCSDGLLPSCWFMARMTWSLWLSSMSWRLRFVTRCSWSSSLACVTLQGFGIVLGLFLLFGLWSDCVSFEEPPNIYWTWTGLDVNLGGLTRTRFEFYQLLQV